MIEPNFDLMLWIIFVTYIIKAIAQLISGAIGMEKEKKYDGGDVLAAIVALGLMAWVAFG